MKIESDERGREAQQSPARRERAHDDRVLSPMMPFSRPLDNTRFTNCNLLTKNGKEWQQERQPSSMLQQERQPEGKKYCNFTSPNTHYPFQNLHHHHTTPSGEGSALLPPNTRTHGRYIPFRPKRLQGQA